MGAAGPAFQLMEPIHAAQIPVESGIPASPTPGSDPCNSETNQAPATF
jgi:hypothetical protein